MKVRILLLGCLLLANLILSAQQYSHEFENVSLEELKMDSYAPDKSAGAVVLLDIGHSDFVTTDEGFEVLFERQTRIKILNESGLRWAEVEIPIYREGEIFEAIRDLEAYTCNLENGQKTVQKLTKADSHDERINEFWVVRKFALPDVKPGTVIEYRYKIYSQYLFNLRDWEFQWKIPVIYSSYRVKMIPFYEYSWLLQGASKFDDQKSYVDPGIERHFAGLTFQNMVHEYTMKNLPAFGEEEYISSFQDYVIKLDFQLAKVNSVEGTSREIMTTWPELVKNLLKATEFGKYVKKSEKAAEDLINLPYLSTLPPKARVDSIISIVKANFNWNGMSSKYAGKTVSDLIKDKYGNSADINLLTVGLLNAAGIKAYPIILSTRQNGKIKADYPFVSFFNYVIIGIESEGVYQLADATDVLLRNDRIPERCINDKGLLVKEVVDNKVEWIGMECNIMTETSTFINISLYKDEYKASFKISASEYDANHLRKKYKDDKKKFLGRDKIQNFSIADSTIRVEGIFERSKKCNIYFDAVGKTSIVNNKIYVSPFFSEVISTNPLTQAKRTYPIDMIYPSRKAYIATINIPEGYEPDYLPEESKISNDYFELTYNALPLDKIVSISFEFRFKKPIYSATDYALLKSYFQEIIKKGNEKIVLRPKL